MPTRVAYSQPQTGLQGFARTVKTIGGTFSLLTTDEVTSNAVAVFRAPKGFIVTGVYLSLPDIDSNGSPTTSVKLGDSGDDDRFVAASNIGQAGGSTTTLASTGLYYEFTDDTDVLLTFATGSATAVAGTGTAYLTGFAK